jgi:glycosyltransferase involved in cell wall biosynthesis
MGKKFYDLLEKLSNVKIMGDISDMGGVYSKTFLLVSPSTHHEAMGRTPLEAMARGIPSVVSGKGGLPEVVGNTGDVVKNIFNIDEWIEKIKRYDTKSYHGKKSSLCKRRVLEFKRKYASQYIKLKKEINKK